MTRPPHRTSRLRNKFLARNVNAAPKQSTLLARLLLQYPNTQKFAQNNGF